MTPFPVQTTTSGVVAPPPGFPRSPVRAAALDAQSAALPVFLCISHLQAVYKNARVGFALCASRVDDPRLRAAVALRAVQCRDSTEQLRDALQPLRESASVASRASYVERQPRAWQPNVTSRDDDRTLLAKYRECEGLVLTSLRDALDAGLPEPWYALVHTLFCEAIAQYRQTESAISDRLPTTSERFREPALAV